MPWSPRNSVGSSMRLRRRFMRCPRTRASSRRSPAPGSCARQLERDREHIQAEHAHPGGAVGLLEVAAGGQGRAAVEYADVVEAQEAALEDIAALGVLAVDPPGEVEEQLVEDALEELTVGL